GLRNIHFSFDLVTSWSHLFPRLLQALAWKLDCPVTADGQNSSGSQKFTAYPSRLRLSRTPSFIQNRKPSNLAFIASDRTAAGARVSRFTVPVTINSSDSAVEYRKLRNSAFCSVGNRSNKSARILMES